MTIKDISEKIISDAKIQADKIIAQAEDNANNITSKGRKEADNISCLLYTSPSPRDRTRSRMPSSA